MTWLANFVFFSGLFLVAGYKTISGASTCGCMGSIEVPPMLFVVIDAVILLFLAIAGRDHFPTLIACHSSSGSVWRSSYALYRGGGGL